MSLLGRFQAHDDRTVIRQDGVVVGEHACSFGRSETIYDLLMGEVRDVFL